jgi:hypothetical protein
MRKLPLMPVKWTDLIFNESTRSNLITKPVLQKFFERIALPMART